VTAPVLEKTVVTGCLTEGRPAFCDTPLREKLAVAARHGSAQVVPARACPGLGGLHSAEHTAGAAQDRSESPFGSLKARRTRLRRVIIIVSIERTMPPL
jgi:hypothetical protein